MELGGLSAILTLMGLMTEFGMWNEDYYRQREMTEEQRDYQSEREDVAWNRNVTSEIDKAQAMMEQGWNPNLVVDSLLGGNSSTPAASSGAPVAPNVESGMAAMASMLGTSMNNILDVQRKASETQVNQSQANKNEVEAGLMPRDFQLRRMSTAAQINAWESSAKLACKQAGYTEEMTKLVENQNLYYGRLTEAQIQSYQAQVAQACADALLKLEQIEKTKKEEELIDTEKAVNVATVQNLHADTALKWTEQSTEYYKSERERIGWEFEQKIGGVPLTADAQKYVNKLAADGNYKEIENFYNTIFATSLNQQLGEEHGTAGRFGLPFNLFNGKPNIWNLGNPYDSRHGVAPYRVPYYNPPR